MQTLTTKIEFLKGAYHGMNENNSLRSFMTIARDAMKADWFSARGIYDKFGHDYRKFFSEFFSNPAENKPAHITNLFTDALIENFFDAVTDKINSMDDDTKRNVLTSAHKHINGNEILTEMRGVKVEQPVKQSETTQTVETNETTIEATPAKVEYKKEQANAQFSLMLPLTAMIDGAVTDYIENKSGLLAHVDDRIKKEAEKLRPNFITIGERKAVEIKGRLHKVFQKTVTLANLERQVFVAGVAGAGKTTLAAQVAEAFSLPFGHISCTAGMSEAHLLGRMNANGDYLKSQFVELYENGGVFLFDEIDAADANTMLIINSALANGHMSVPNRKDQPTAKRHKDFICMCAANTWGFGSNEYAGRNILDAAFLDRFAGSKVLVEYDTELETEISKDVPEVAETIWKIRANVVKNRIRRVVSTRSIVSETRQRMAGIDLKDYLNTFFTGWTDEEQKKAKEGL